MPDAARCGRVRQRPADPSRAPASVAGRGVIPGSCPAPRDFSCVAHACRKDTVRREWVAETRGQIATYKRFKRLVDEWVDLAIERAQHVMRMEKKKLSR